MIDRPAQDGIAGDVPTQETTVGLAQLRRDLRALTEALGAETAPDERRRLISRRRSLREQIDTLSAPSAVVDREAAAARPRRLSLDPIFVVGCPHSGTSLLTAMLGAHPAIYAIPVETKCFLPDGGEPPVAILARHQKDARAKNARWICEKTPLHIQHIGAIRRHFPDAPIIAIVRDPRDVCSSLRVRLGGDLAAHAAKWSRLNAGAVDRQSRHDDVVIVRYEDLVEDARAVLATVCAAIGVDFDAAMLEYYKDDREWFGAQGREETDGSAGRNHNMLRNWQIHEPIMDRRERWRSILLPEEAARIDAVCADLMQRFGYEPSGDFAVRIPQPDAD